MIFLKILSIVLIFFAALVAGVYPYFKKWRTGFVDFPIGQALASGVFLGAGLIHMLGDAAQDFVVLHVIYPLPFLITGITFLGFLAMEHVGREVYHHDGISSKRFAVIAVLMLSVHSIFEGAALGLGNSMSVIIVLLIAILAHKWAASFALAVQINKSELSTRAGLSLFFLFVLMTPLGIAFGSIVATMLSSNAYVLPIFNSIAAGTFLYLGTLHGLSNSFMVQQCCNLRNFMFVIIGFSIMAIVAIWT